MKKTVIVGLGNLGLAVGRRLHRFIPGRLVGVDIDEGRRDVWKVMSGEASFPSLQELNYNELQRIFIVVNTEDQAGEVLQILEEQCSKTVQKQPVYIYLLTTISPGFAEKLARFPYLSVHLVEMPVSGGEARVLEGDLLGLNSGNMVASEEVFLRGSLFSHLVHFSGFGQPSLAKLLHNAVIAYQVAGLKEVVLLAKERDLDLQLLLEVISHGQAYSFISTAIFHYHEKLLAKDMQLLANYVNEIASAKPTDVEQNFNQLRQSIKSK